MTDDTFNVPQYFASDVAGAAGVDTVTLQNWIKRGAVEFSEYDREGKGSGSRHLFTMCTALRIAITAELVRNGITPLEANKVAGRVSMVAGSKKFRPGLKLGDGRTYLAISPGSDDIIEIFDGADYSIDLLFGDSDDRSASVIVLELSKIAGRVRDRLVARA